jgi:sirohydrochlorin ferrochelatase
MTRLVACSHGTRSEVGAARVSALVGAVAAAMPSLDVVEAHVDVHGPFLHEVLTPGSVVVPLLLAAGYHVETDIGRAAEAVGARVTAPLGPDGLLVSLIGSRLRELPEPIGEDDVVVLAAAGSSAPGSAMAAREMARLLSARLGVPVHAGYGAKCAPRLGDLVTRLRSEHPGRRIVAASYLLAPGHFHDVVRSCGADAVTDPLLVDGPPDPRLVEVVVGRFLDECLAAAV